MSVHAPHQFGGCSIPELDLARAVAHREDIPLSDPGDRADVLVLGVHLTQLHDGTIRSVPDVDPHAEGHGHVVEAAPVHQVEVEVVQHVGSVKDLVGSRGNVPGVDSFGGCGFSCGIENFHVIHVSILGSWGLGLEGENP